MTLQQQNNGTVRQLPTANAQSQVETNRQRLRNGQTFYFTAAQIRAGEVDLTPLWDYISPSLVANLLASLPVLSEQNSTTPKSIQSAKLPNFEGA